MKEFLYNNKIYFESLLPLVIFIFTIVTYYSTQKISTLQATLARAQIEPFFVLENYTVVDKKTGYAIEEQLLIKNLGAPVNNTDTKTYSYIDIEYGEQPNRREVRLPINGYYFISSRVNEDKTLFKKHAHSNLQKFFQIYKDAINYKGVHGLVFVKLVHYTTISYLNYINEQNEIYFFNNMRLTAPNEAQRWIQLSKENMILDTDRDSLATILNKIEELSQSKKIENYTLN